MIVYIPFNSNDFNSIFSTLSISPHGFYQQRGYSFRRSTSSVLNPFDNFLIAYPNQVMHNLNNDKEGGFPVLLCLNISQANLKKLQNIGNIEAFYISKTIIFLDRFKLFFRTNAEQDEVFARSLKSIETKYTELARERSFIIEDSSVTWINEEPKSSQSADEITDFKYERIINKAQGAILGYSIGVISNLHPPIKELKLKARELRNVSSMYLNSLSSENSSKQKKRVESCLDDIGKSFQELESLEESFILESNGVTSAIFGDDLNQTYFGFNKFDLIIEGLLTKDFDGLPRVLKVEKAKRVISSHFNSTYPQSYISKVQSVIAQLIEEVDIVTKSGFQGDSVNQTFKILSFKVSEGKFCAQVPRAENSRDSLLLSKVLDFFLTKANLSNPDELFAQRESIVGELGLFLSDSIPDWESSDERKFLGGLFKAFKSLRSEFSMSDSTDTMKAIGLIFTQGRDFLKFLDALPSSGIVQYEYPISIWGAAFGAASFPKTQSNKIFEKPELKEAYFKSLSDLISNSNNDAILFPDSETNSSQSKFDTTRVDDMKNTSLLGHFESALKSKRGYRNNDLFVEKAVGILSKILLDKNSGSLFSQESDYLNDFREKLKLESKSVKGFGGQKIEIAVSTLKDIQLKSQ